MGQVFLIVAFPSTHDAIKAETVAKRAGLSVRVIPLPPEVSAGCGLALRSPLEEEAALRELLDREEVKGDFYRLTREGTTRTVIRLEE